MLSSTTFNPYIESSPYFIYDHHQPNHHHQLPISDPLSSNGDHHYRYASSSAVKGRKKKDRHSKIYTAQGLRDRRVRLSIAIARKFFDLQDMLGFDKASKTLDWLLTKSKEAIKELAKINYNGNINKSLCSNSSEEVVSEPEEGNLVSKNQKITQKLKKKAAALSSSTLNLVAAKESREKARARARERTRVKLLYSTAATPNTSKINLDPTFEILNQSRSSGPSSSGCYSSNHILPNPSSSFRVVAAHHQAEDQPNNHHNIIEESIVIKRKLMGTYQPNLLMLKDANCNTYSNNFPNLVPNWDNNSAIARSSLCANITNMNRSTGLQLYGQLWEAENGECLH